VKAKELRKSFTDFFVERDHQRIPSASLIPHDQTLLFVNSGMVPFKPYFVGEEKPEHNRAVTVQKCVRAGGKHNDLDEVGRTTRHLTFFEMMGNFSFGDYFKEEAIPMAWELVTEVFGLDPERLWVTVHLSDDEAAEIWEKKVGVPADRIQRLDEDNWWRMADTGPNGPCSEIFVDMGPEFGEDGGPEFGSEDRFIEIWNLVFMQFETDEEGNSHPLPKPSIDTGAGLERILMILQNKKTVFEIDEMAELITAAEQITGYTLGQDDNSDLALRVLAEHARTMAFLISDGVFPSNEDRGFVLRRIMRRAIRFAYLLGVQEIVTGRLVDKVVEIMGTDYPQLVTTHELIRSVVEREETQFRRTLASGSAILDEQLSKLQPGAELSGSVAFLLHDTYGFPFEVTAEVVAERGFSVDRAGFESDMADQRTRAKEARQSATISIDVARRDAIRRNHTGTHLLHWALAEVLGDHVKQQGSMVGPERLRFDFSHFDPVTPEQITMIEDLVNEQVLANPHTEHPEVTKSKAEEMGAIAFFGDKYGDLVRVLRAGPSLEFCGGTHVSALGDIGLIKIVAESSIGSNLRRVEAVTGAGAVDMLRSEQAVVDEVAAKLGVPRVDLIEGLSKRLDELADLKSQVKALEGRLAVGQAGELAEAAVDGVVVARIDGMSRDQLKDLAVAVRDQEAVSAVVFGARPMRRPPLWLPRSFRPRTQAGALIAEGGKGIKGGGGKGADLGDGPVVKNPDGVDDALEPGRQGRGIWLLAPGQEAGIQKAER
ncbi:UNVERIFIED_CONTAM: hypothetical protein GTU68_028258, partial [Idotea baltica]|nr:hypothetical protein [Idotea baltica]